MPKPHGLCVLGLESSCDETAAAVVCLDTKQRPVVLAEQVASQIAVHARYGGVVPEIAARAHVELFPTLLQRTLAEAQITLNALDAIAVTTGPGLIGGLLVGSMYGRSIALRHDLPCIGIHHLEGHVLSPRLSADYGAKPVFPFLVLLASGGHTMIVLAHDVGHYRILGRSRDDALGEAFDKSAMVMGLEYPGGPVIERLAKQGDATRFALPTPLVGARDKADRQSCDFSFSGLKTAVARHWARLEPTEDTLEASRADLSTSLQQAVARVLCDRLHNALQQCRIIYPNKNTGWEVAFVGGVAANQYLRQSLQSACHANDASLSTVPLRWCTDNASMIAWAALERMRAGKPYAPQHLPARPRWSLETIA